MMSSAAGGDADVGHTTRPRLGRALVRRELTLSLLVLVLLAAVLGVGAAHEYGRMRDAGDRTPVLHPILRHFDLTMMYLMALLLTFRLAARTESDQLSGWLEPVFAAGGARWPYGVQLALACLIPPAAAFAATAVSFAAGIAAFTGSTELVHALPATLGGGILMLGTFAACAGLLGVLFRSGSATVVLTLLLLLAPLVAALRFASSGSLPGWLIASSYLAPLPGLPGELRAVVRGILYIAVGLAATAVASYRFAGRQQ